MSEGAFSPLTCLWCSAPPSAVSVGAPVSVGVASTTAPKPKRVFQPVYLFRDEDDAPAAAVPTPLGPNYTHPPVLLMPPVSVQVIPCACTAPTPSPLTIFCSSVSRRHGSA